MPRTRRPALPERPIQLDHIEVVGISPATPRTALGITRGIVIETGWQRYVLVAGHAALQRAQSERRMLRCVMLDDVTPFQMEELRRLAAQPVASSAQLIELVQLLYLLGVPSTQIAAALPLSASEVSRLRKAADDPLLREALAAGKIGLHHLRVLLTVPEADRPDLIVEVEEENPRDRHAWNKLLQKPSSGLSGSDTPSEVEKQLSSVLGTEVRVHDHGGGTGEFRAIWTHGETLMGILEQVGKAPYPMPLGLPVEERTLAIRYLSLDEFDAMFGHLFGAV